LASRLEEFGIGLGFFAFWLMVLVVSLAFLTPSKGPPLLMMRHGSFLLLGWFALGLIMIGAWREEKENSLYSALGYALIPIITIVANVIDVL